MIHSREPDYDHRQPIRRAVVLTGLALVVGLVLALVTTGAVAAQESVSECTTIDESGEYEIAQNLTSNETCLTITADDVTLDGGANTIDIDDSSGEESGILVEGADVTLSNVNTNGSDDFGDGAGIRVRDTSEVTLEDINSAGNSAGIYLENAQAVTVDGAEFQGGDDGLETLGSHNLTIKDIRADNTSTGLTIAESTAVTMEALDISGATAGVNTHSSSDNLTIEQADFVDVGSGVRTNSVTNVTITNVVVNNFDHHGVNLFSTNDATVQDVEIDGAGPGLRIHGENYRVTDVETRAGPEITTGFHVRSGSANVSISDSTVEYATDTGILVAGAEDVSLTDVDVDISEGKGIHVTEGWNSPTSNLSLERVETTSWGDGGIIMEYVDGLTVTEFTVGYSATGAGIEVAHSTDATIADGSTVTASVRNSTTVAFDAVEVIEVINGSDIVDMTVTDLELGSLATVDFELIDSDLELETIAEPLAPPEPYYEPREFLEISEVRPGEDPFTVEAGPDAEYPLLSAKTVANDSWADLEETFDEEAGTVTATVQPDGQFGVFGIDEVDELLVSEPTLSVGEETNLTAVAQMADGTTIDVSDETTFDTTDPDVFTTTSWGAATAEGVGEANATAAWEDVNGTGLVTVEGPDEVPETYYGNLTINGDPAPTGTVVEAYIGDELRGSVTVETEGTYGSDGVFDDRLEVHGTSVEEGETVTFEVIPPDDTILDAGTANETSPFEPEAETALDLTATVEEFGPAVYEGGIANDGAAHTIGFPGPVDDTVGDVFPGGYDGIQSIWLYENESWERITDPNRSLDALSVLTVTTAGEEGPATIDVEVTLSNETVASNKTLTSGWNLVAAPKHTDAESAFGDVEDAVLVLDRYGHPAVTGVDAVAPFSSYVLGSTAWGEEAPAVTPFTGYFVYTEAETEVPVAAADVPHKQAADEALEIE